jgi:large subunit ribosomal protein L25
MGKFKIQAEPRSDVGKGASRRLRHAGRVPAIVYGAGREPVSVTVDHNYMFHAIEDESFTASVLEVVMGDKTQKVVLRDLQRHPYKPVILHADFQRVRDDEVIRLNVPLHFVNADDSPAGKKAGVVVSFQANEVEISSLPGDLPEYIEVDLANLEPGESVMLSQLELPKGVTLPLLEYSPESDYALVSAIFIRASQGTGEAAAEADAAMADGAEVPATAVDDTSEEGGEADAGDDANKAE